MGKSIFLAVAWFFARFQALANAHVSGLAQDFSSRRNGSLGGGAQFRNAS